MSVTCEKVNFENLKPARSLEEHLLHLAAIEWSLSEPIVITGKQDIKSEVNWRGRFEPYHHQVENLIRYCRMLPVTLLADDVGLGKTISAGLILAELIERKRVSRCFVVCPSILGPQWVEEMGSKFGIAGVFATGQELNSVIERSAVPVVVTTYQTASNRIASIKSDQFDMLILDEAHKLRNLHGTQNAPQMALRIRSALEHRLFKYVLMLTATPIQNRVWDLYSLIDLLTVAKGHRNPLGSPNEFRLRYVADAAGRRLDKTHSESFRSILRQYVVRTRREDAKLVFPEREVATRKLRKTEVETELESIVASEIGKLKAFGQISLSQAMMSSPQALAAQMQNMAAGGNISQVVADKVQQLANRAAKSAKMEGLLAFVRELRSQRPKDWRLVVFTLRKETQDAIGRALQAEGIAVEFIRGGSAQNNQRAIDKYKASPPLANVIVSTDAGAEGVNLQAGNVLVNYDLPWNPMVMEQRIGRIQRLASTHESVVIVNLVMANSVEERVVERLIQKLQVIAETIGDIETILESAGQDDDSSFEDMIRKLVVASLTGQDIEQATKAAAASIELAKARMQEERGAINEVFGPSKPNEPLGPKPPKLEPLKPSVPPDQFVMRALAAEGAMLRPRADDTIDVIRSGQANERITFKPEVAEQNGGGVFMGNAPRLYLPGRPGFERLVQRWLQRGGHALRDLATEKQAAVEDTASSWCSTVPDATFRQANIVSSKRQVTGTVTCRVKAANGVDSLEKLVTLPAAMTTDPELAKHLESLPISTETLSADRAFDGAEGLVSRSVTSDPDVKEFCRFYDARRTDELSRAGHDSRQRHKIETDFGPKVFADVVALSGARFETVVANVHFVLDGHYPYSVELELLPVANRVISEPIRRRCVLTERDLPRACLGVCELTGSFATAHMLVQSSVSKRLALPTHTVQCSVSGDTLLSDEAWQSDVTGRIAKITLFRQSPISQRKGLDDEFAVCEFTDEEVLVDELKASHVSGKKYRIDEEEVSSSGVSGHQSEFVRCSETGEALLPEQVGSSALSGKRVRVDLLVASQKPPHRLGTQSETVTCAISGATLLKDEVVASLVSGRLMDRDLAAHSDENGLVCLPEELVTCAITGKKLLPDEVDASEVSDRLVSKSLLKQSAMSGRKALREELTPCQITGDLILPDEAVKSEESQRLFRKDQAMRSAASGKLGHKSEFATCTQTGASLLKSETACSSISGKRYAKSLLKFSQKTPTRCGLEDDLVTCAKTGKRLLFDEAVKSAVSGKWIDRDLAAVSARSGRPALEEELVTCEELGIQLLPEECERCSITGKRVEKSLLGKSDVSGKFALKSLLEQCSVTKQSALPTELETCEATHKRAVANEMTTCVVSHKRVLKSLVAHSAVSDLPVLLELAVRSPITKRFCLPTEAAACTWHNAQFPRDELGICRLTGLVFSKDLLNSSNELRPLRELLDEKGKSVSGSDLVEWLAKQGGLWSGAKEVRCVFSESGEVRAICAKLSSMLGLKVRYAGAIVSEQGQRRVLGRIVSGKRGPSGWSLEA